MMMMMMMMMMMTFYGTTPPVLNWRLTIYAELVKQNKK